MPERSQDPEDLELYRDQFLNQLRDASPQLQGHQDFMRYWKVVESEAQQTEDLGKLDGWVKDLSRDKDEVQAMKTRLEGMDERDPVAEAMLNLLRMLLEYLDGIYKKIRRIFEDRRNILATLLWKAGPGVKPKPDEDEASTAKGGPKKDGAVPAAVLDKSKDATKQAPEVKAQEKKMQR